MKRLALILSFTLLLFACIQSSCGPPVGPQAISCVPQSLDTACVEQQLLGSWIPKHADAQVPWFYWYADSVVITQDSLFAFNKGQAVKYKWRWQRLSYDANGDANHGLALRNNFWPNDSIWRNQVIVQLDSLNARWMVNTFAANGYQPVTMRRPP